MNDEKEKKITRLCCSIAHIPSTNYRKFMSQIIWIPLMVNLVREQQVYQCVQSFSSMIIESFEAACRKTIKDFYVHLYNSHFPLTLVLTT